MTVQHSPAPTKVKRSHTKARTKRSKTGKTRKLNADASRATDHVAEISTSNPVNALRAQSPTATEEVADSVSYKAPKTKRSATKTRTKRSKTRKLDADASLATNPVTKILTSNPVDALRAHPPTATGDVADSTANDAVGGADTIATQALGKLFESSDAVDNSVLDGFYSIRDMDGFEKWISDHKSTLCNSGFEPDKPNKKTLVLDLDNTLISSDGYEGDFVVDCNNGKRYSILLHPDCITFLHEMVARYAEIAIYTSSSYVYTTKIACQIEVRYARAYPHEDRLPFSKILSSDDCILDGAERKKDLHRLRSEEIKTGEGKFFGGENFWATR
ncbi:hypothetical protein PGT21_025086 [Puccinia graminis f. sp. tritici]|uniref:Mitochondrial import inner membrane translocase subunit TIM50 n=1 Tax=Puccinia graminis f. sp. tritici TaxID=56615 RepID=A0A5B0N3E2_PUCGR|nr:hypothetical protein PGT21_025086 [Puccinia graminis f. sp. tritici]KAA1123964.1 hypothetical protein PGTUg99_013132 [Puccinia graminis f. sp. tritici]